MRARAKSADVSSRNNNNESARICRTIGGQRYQVGRSAVGKISGVGADRCLLVLTALGLATCLTVVEEGFNIGRRLGYCEATKAVPAGAGSRRNSTNIRRGTCSPFGQG